MSVVAAEKRSTMISFIEMQFTTGRLYSLIINDLIIINDFYFMHPKFTIGYSRRGNTNKVYVQRSKKKLQKIKNIIYKFLCRKF